MTPSLLVYPRFRWLMLLALCLVTAASTMIMISPAPLVGVIAKQFNTSLGSTTAYTMGVWNLVLAVSCIVGGVMCDRVGLIPVLLFCAVMLICPTLAVPHLGNSVGGLVLVRVLQALGGGPILAAVSPLAALWFPTHERGIVAGLQGTAVSLGIAVGFVAGPALLGATGSWQVAMAWLSVGGFVALAVTLVAAVMPRPPLPVTAGDVYESTHSMQEEVRLAYAQKATWVGAFLLFCFMWLLNSFNDLTPAYLAVDPPLGLGFGPMSAGKHMMTLEIAYMFGAGASGFVMEKVFRGRAKPAIAIGFLLFAFASVSILLPVVTSVPPLLLICLMTAGFFQAWVVPCAQGFVALHYPPHVTGKVIGTWLGLGVCGGTVGVLAGALALRHTGSYSTSVLIVGGISLCGFVATLFLKPPAVFRSVGGSDG